MSTHALFGFRFVFANRLANLSVVLASLASFAVIPGLERMLGFLGFLSLIGAATLVEFISRKPNSTHWLEASRIRWRSSD